MATAPIFKIPSARTLEVLNNPTALAREYRIDDKDANRKINNNNTYNSHIFTEVNRFPGLLAYFNLTEDQLRTLERREKAGWDLYYQIINPSNNVGKRHATRGVTGIRHKTRGRKNRKKKNKTNRRR